MYTPKGQFAWYELMSPDTAASADFYSKVIGWTTQDVGSAEMPYTTFNIGASGVAGILPLPHGAPPSWIGYIHVDDVDAHCAKITEAGAKVWRQPTDVPGMLRFAVASDPQGAPIVLFTPNPAMPSPADPPKPPTAGTFGWSELYTSDVEAATEFYSTYFGWTKLNDMDMGPMGTYRIFSDGDAAKTMGAGGMMTKPPNIPHSSWGFYICTDNATDTLERIKENGGNIIHGPAEVPGGSWIVQATDPQGILFATVSTAK